MCMRGIVNVLFIYMTQNGKLRCDLIRKAGIMLLTACSPNLKTKTYPMLNFDTCQSLELAQEVQTNK
jgi:hypothetical protein